MAWDISINAGLDDRAFKEGLSRMQSESSRHAQRIAQTIESQVGGYRKLASTISGTFGAVTGLLGTVGLIAGAVWGAVEAAKAFSGWINQAKENAATLRQSLDETLRSIAKGDDPGLQKLLDQMKEADEAVERIRAKIRGARRSYYSPGDEFTLESDFIDEGALQNELDRALQLQTRARENLERRQREIDEREARERFKREMESTDQWYEYYMKMVRRAAEERRKIEEHWARVFEERNDRLYRQAMRWVDRIIADRQQAAAGTPAETPRTSYSTFSSGLSTAPRLIARAIGSGPDPAAAAAARREQLFRQILETLNKVRKTLDAPIMLEVGP